jgi:hypothetical protein
MLDDTVLKPIGEYLKVIIDGGCFVLQKDNASDLLAVNFTLTVTIFLFYFFYSVVRFLLIACIPFFASYLGGYFK